MRLSENTILITGGASGIGLALAEAFLFHQNTVIVCGRDKNKLDALKEKHENITTIACDVTDNAQVLRMKEQIADQFPQFNILINNAGIQQPLDFYEEENLLEKIDAEIDTNFRAALHLTTLFMPLFKQTTAAAVINISSLLAIIPKKSAPVYCATKAALHAFSQSLRYQLEHRRIKVFEIIVPMVETAMTRGRKSGVKRISPQELVAEVIRGLEKDVYEIHAGISKTALFINHHFPGLMKMIAKRR